MVTASKAWTGAGACVLSEHVIRVWPAGEGWQVECPLTGGPLTFESGDAAQSKARALAMCVAGLGLDVQVLVHDATEALRSTARYFADDPEGADLLAAAFAAATAHSPITSG
jgi:hypothetical protein